MLVSVYMKDCVRMIQTETADGLGGFISGWTQGDTFRAAVVKEKTQEGLTAEKQEIAQRYRVTVDQPNILRYHDVFVRVEDGAVFRVTSDITDSESPPVASFALAQVTAERWELT